MKNFLTALLLLVFMLTFSGCQSTGFKYIDEDPEFWKEQYLNAVVEIKVRNAEIERLSAEREKVKK